MKQKLLKELAIFGVLFVVLALIVHKDQWLEAPIAHLMALSKHVLPIHPILYVLVIYLVVFSLRFVVSLTRSIFSKRTPRQ